jgi:hypothetical protein
MVACHHRRPPHRAVAVRRSFERARLAGEWGSPGPSGIPGGRDLPKPGFCQGSTRPAAARLVWDQEGVPRPPRCDECHTPVEGEERS